MKYFFKNTFLPLLVSLMLFSSQSVIGQSNFQSESEMQAKAAEYFTADQFVQAFPLYSQLLSLDPENIEFNYRFGVCLLYTDRANTEEPFKYLEKAINKVSDIDLYYHLAVAYHNNYFFTDAIYNYRKYLQLARNNERKDYDADRKIEMCQNGIEMLKAVNDLYVMQNSEVERQAFYRSYDLVDFGGRIINIPEEFLSKSDLKNQDDKVTFFNPKAELLFYALNNKNQKDIYYRIRQKNGDWSSPILLSNRINTSYDEDNPFLMPDGKTLYFSSKGHNTIGGFDIFRSVYDSVSKQWSNPVNLSFPFNTPSDDILFISDAEENTAWFASNRNSLNDKISVYKVGIIKKEQQSADLSDVFDKENLSSKDLGRIKNMAQLDINISDKAFKEIPVNQKHKLDALLKNDATRITQNIRQTSLINLDKQLEGQGIRTDLNDSIKTVVQQIDSKLENLKSLFLQTQELVSAKSGLVQQGYTDVSMQLEKAQKTALPNRRKELIGQANKTMFKTLRNDVQLNKLSTIEKAINKQISSQRDLLAQVNIIYGDIQKNIVTRNDADAEKYIRLLNQLIINADTLSDYTKVVDYAKGDIIDPNYPANLLDENSFTAYTIQNEDEYLSPIIALETRYSNYIPELSVTTDLELLKRIENKTSAARAKDKQFSYQLRLMESLINEKQQTNTLLLKEANRLVTAFDANPSENNLKAINLIYAEARRSAYDIRLAQQIYDSLKFTSNQSGRIAEELSSLKSRIERLIERGENKEAFILAAQVEELEAQGNKLPTYEKSIDFDKKELLSVNYPEALKNVDSYIEYNLINGKLQRSGATEFNYNNIQELIARSNQKGERENTTDSKPLNEQQTLTAESSNSAVSKSNPTNQQIRESLATLSQKQSERIEQLKQQSTLLSKKADEKLQASNNASTEFERMREQYNDGQTIDQKTVLDKQSESQNLLYQSLALNSYVEKIDSIIQSEQKQKEESTNQIFAIEQAMQTDQPEKAQALYRVLDKNTTLPKEEVESLVQIWIDKGIANIPKQKSQANQAFENSQKLTDASIQLIIDAQKIRKDAQDKSNAFKSRELDKEAQAKEVLAIQKQDQADKQLAIGTNIYEGIKKAEAIQLIASEFPSQPLLAVNANPITNTEKSTTDSKEILVTPEKQMIVSAEPKKILDTPDKEIVSDESKKILDTPEKESLVSAKPNAKSITEIEIPKPKEENPPVINDLTSYETKRYKAQLLADELEINKTETNYFLEIKKTLSGEAAVENNQKITALQKEAEFLQTEYKQAKTIADNSYKQLPTENKKQTDKNTIDFDDYLKNVRNRIAQLLDDVTLLSEQASATQNETSRESLILQADEKEKIATYLILEEYEIIAKRNKQNYRKNSLVIEKLLQEIRNNQEKEIMKDKFDQIEAYLLQANNNHIKAKSEELSFTLKRALLQDAFLQETSALDLQLEAIRMMRENETQRMLASQTNNRIVTPTELAESKGNTSKPTESTANTNRQTSAAITKNTAEEPLNLASNSFELPNIFPNVNIGQVPGGTRFSIQIAAIGGLRTIDHFMNVIELFAIKDKEKELFRYFSGNFSSLQAAIIRRNSLRLQGYSDAFIKSWKDGESVSISEAVGELDEATNNLLHETVIALPSQYRNINFSATNISQLNGVYYSVQVGVFSRPRSSAQLFDIKPLYHSRLKNGNWVYYNGIFKSIADADENKTTIHKKGIPDAFVVAFNDGEKVSFANARQAIRQGLSQPADEDIIILEDASLAVDEQLKIIISPTSATPIVRVYKVQIGVFSEAVSFTDLSAKLSPNNIHRIEYFINSAGKYVYTVGSFNSYEEAAEFKTKQLQEIIKDAFIVVFENGNKI